MKKNIIYLIVILVALLTTAIFVMQKQGEQSMSADSAQKFIPIDSASMEKVSVESSQKNFILERSGDVWSVTSGTASYNADKKMLADFLHELSTLKIKSIVSTNPEKQSLFNVDSNGITVEIFGQGKAPFSFIVGKSGQSDNDTYVRIKESHNVLLVDAQLTNMLSKHINDWRDKTVLSVPQQNITEVTFQYGDTTFVLKRINSTWMIGNDSTQENVINSLLASLADLKADNFLDSTNAATKKVMAKITVASSQLLFALDKEKNVYYLLSSASPQWFVVEPWKANQLLKRKRDLVKK